MSLGPWGSALERESQHRPPHLNLLLKFSFLYSFVCVHVSMCALVAHMDIRE